MPRILLVDDERDLVELLSALLGMYGYEVVGFTDPLEALQALDQVNPDVVLADLLMPTMTGASLLGCIDHRSEFAGIPAVLLTGIASGDPTLTQLRTCPGVGVLEKPCDPETIAAEVNRLLSEARITPDFRRQAAAARRGLLSCILPTPPSEQAA